jgi:hypothetical protein
MCFIHPNREFILNSLYLYHWPCLVNQNTLDPLFHASLQWQQLTFFLTQCKYVFRTYVPWIHFLWLVSILFALFNIKKFYPLYIIITVTVAYFFWCNASVNLIDPDYELIFNHLYLYYWVWLISKHTILYSSSLLLP